MTPALPTLGRPMSATECRRAIECAGGAVRYSRAWPLIGRGGVRHDLATHEEVEALLDAGLHPPFFRRLGNLLRGIPWK